MALVAQIENADRILTRVRASSDGLEIVFADDARGLVPWGAIPEVDGLKDVASIELPNAYEIALRTRSEELVELPWDFARQYCDPSYRRRVEAHAAAGRRAIGARIKRLRLDRRMTQAQLAEASGVGRVTLVRIEKGEQSPRYDTLLALASSLQQPASALMEP